MKRTASILLLCLLLFNWIGYRMFTAMLERKANIALEASIDRSEYDESNLIEITVPMNTPYLAGLSDQYERFAGEVEIDGVHYKYVKRKVANGELVLLCLPNETKSRFQNSRVEFFKLVNDLNASGDSKEKKSNTTSSFKSLDYTSNDNNWHVHALAIKPSMHGSVLPSFYRTIAGEIITPPPRG